MKGSPILATALACIIMLSMYVGMRSIFSQDKALITNSASVTKTDPAKELQTDTAYADLYFSAKPKSLSIHHPATNTLLLSLTDIEDFEWSGNIILPKDLTKELELLCKIEWVNPTEGYQFIQLTLSPNNLGDQTQTLKSEGDIEDIMNFHWKEGSSE